MGAHRSAEQGAGAVAAGVFLIDKPKGATSFSIVRTVRRLLGIKKVGHAGTLDPFATGLLIVCAGRPATRLIERFMAGRKVYRALVQLGRETETLDPEGRVTREAQVPDLGEKELRTCLAGLVGRQQQVPPPYSAVKYKGKPLYHYARQGIAVTKEPKEIEIFALDYLGYDPVRYRLEMEVTCSRGTYIRVLAADIGTILGCGAHLVELQRLGSGRFALQDALPGEALSDSGGLELLLDKMLSVEQAAAMLGEPVSAGFESQKKGKNACQGEQINI